jgi:UDP-N-acetylmuramyl pentapeptide phosphotransferase/UDP-N-acetylglucosamine-1-phosphate transferase
MSILALSLLVALSFLTTAVVTGWLRKTLMRKGVLDHPGARSSHQTPTPRGGGLAIHFVLLPAWGIILATSPQSSHGIGWIILCSIGLAIPAFVDDVKGLPMLPRFIWQIVIATAGMLSLTGPVQVFQGVLPPTVDSLATVFVWVAFINLFNFTDGIDGNASVKAICLGLGMFVVSLFGAIPHPLGELSIVTAAAVAGFLVWNWHPAKIFMGDVGSVPLGFLLGWLLLRMAGEGLWAPALILPLLYLTDTGLTYLAKIVRRERFWHTHRDHYYQRAVRLAGVSHSDVVKIFLLGDMALIGWAVLAALGYIRLSLLGAGATAGIVMLILTRGLSNREIE